MPAPAVRMILRLGAAELLIAGEHAHGVVNAAVGLTKSGGAEDGALLGAGERRPAPHCRGGTGALGRAIRRSACPAGSRAPSTRRPARTGSAPSEAAHEAGAPLDLTPRDGGNRHLRGGAASHRQPAPERCRSGFRPAGLCRGRLVGAGRRRGPAGEASGAMWVACACWTCAPHRVARRCNWPLRGAEVVALDASDTRLDRLRENLARTGLSARNRGGPTRWSTRTATTRSFSTRPAPRPGTIRRHPDLPFVKSGSRDRRP